MVKIYGKAAFTGKLKEISGPEMERQVEAALKTAAEMIEVEAALSITTGSSSAGRHIVSLPGQPPNEDTGVLSRNITSRKLERLTYGILSEAPYAAALEFGTSRMQERPYMRPALAKHKDEAVSLVRRAMDKVIKGGKVT